MNKRNLKKFIPETLKDTQWIGVVKDDVDPLGASRVRVSIPRLTDEIPVDHLPWYVLSSKFAASGNAAADTPPIDSRVRLVFLEDDIYSGFVTSNIVSIPPT